MEQEKKKGRSIWLYLGCGCLVVIVAVTLAFCGGIYACFKKVEQFGETMKDPEARRNAVMEILGAETLPPQMNSHFGFSMPFDALQVAALGSGTPTPGSENLQDLGDTGFIYFELMTWGKKEQTQLDEFLQGKSASVDVFEQNNIDMDTSEIIGRGEVPVTGGNARYVSMRGQMNTASVSREVLTSVIVFQCSSDSRVRLALWYEPDTGLASSGEAAAVDAPAEPGATESPAEPAPAPEAETPDPTSSDAPAPQLAGTVGDPARLSEFLGHFRVCR